MFEKSRIGWRLASSTRKLIFKDKKLLLYPVVSALFVILELAAIFGSGLLVSYLLYGIRFTGPLTAEIWILCTIAFYIVSIFSSTYVSLAMLMGFRSYLSGSDIGLRRALRETRSYAKVVLQWALFFALVLLLLRIVGGLLMGAGQFLVRIVFSIIGSFTISVATIFILPVILDEKAGPMKAIKDSVGFLTKNFGSTFGGLIFSDLYSLGLAMIGAVLMFGITIAGIALSSFALFLVGLISGLAIIVFALAISSVLGTAFKFILYEHFSGRGLPEGFNADMIMGGIKQKSSAGSKFVNLVNRR